MARTNEAANSESSFSVLNFVFADVPLVQSSCDSDSSLVLFEEEDEEEDDDDVHVFCEGGISAVMALLRHHGSSSSVSSPLSSSSSSSSLVLPTLDFQSPLVHMHPLRLGANRIVHEGRYGLQTYAAYGYQLKLDETSSSVSSTSFLWGDLDALRDDDTYRPTIGSLSVAPNNPWSRHVQHVHFHQQTGMAVIYVEDQGPSVVGGMAEQNTVRRAPIVDTVLALLEYIATRTWKDANANVDTGANITNIKCHVPTRNPRGGTTSNVTVTTTASDSIQDKKMEEGPLMFPTNCWLPVVVDDRIENNNHIQQQLLDALAESKYPPAILLQLQSQVQVQAPSPPPGKDSAVDDQDNQTQHNTTDNTHAQRIRGRYDRGMWVASYQRKGQDFLLFQMRVKRQKQTQQREQFANTTTTTKDNNNNNNTTMSMMTIDDLTLITQKVTNLPESARDEAYFDDVQFLRQHLVKPAEENDPVVGTTTGMPPQTFRRQGDGTQVAVCLIGECPIGNLFADGMREQTQADISYVNPLGVRGPGWDPGPVKMSMLFEALPFPDSLCTGKISGISLYRIFDIATNMALFKVEVTPQNGWLLQVSGARIVYNPQLSSSRLISIDIWNRTTNTLEPLDRRKIYKIALGDYDCLALQQFFDIDFSVPGEEPFVIENILVHDVVATYLQQLGRTYDTSLSGRLVNNTRTTVAMDWLQTEDSCPPGAYWDASFAVCEECPNMTNVVFREKQVRFEGESGSDFIYSDTIELLNGEDFPVSVKLKSSPTWVEVSEETASFVSLGSRQELLFRLGASAVDLEPGTARGTVSFQVLDGGTFSRCQGKDATFEVLMKANPPPKLNKPGRITLAGLVCVGFVLALAAYFARWVWEKRKESVVGWMQPPLLLAVCTGVSIISLSVIPLSTVDNISSQSGRNMACMAFPWLFCCGFSVVMTALFYKLWSANRVFRPFRRANINGRHGYVALASMLCLNFALLLLWTLIDPLEWTVQSVSQDEPWNLYGACRQKGTAGWVFLGLAVTLNFVALLAALYQAFKARNIDPAFSVSRSLLYALFSWIEILIVGLPVIFLIDRSNSSAFYFVQSGVILSCCLSMLLLIFTRLRLEYRRTLQTQRGERRSTMFVPAARKPSNRRSTPDYGLDTNNGDRPNMDGNIIANYDSPSFGSTANKGSSRGFGVTINNESTRSFGLKAKDTSSLSFGAKKSKTARPNKIDDSAKRKETNNDSNESELSLTPSEIDGINAAAGSYTGNDGSSSKQFSTATSYNNGFRPAVKKDPLASVMASPVPGDSIESSVSETQNHSQQSEEDNTEPIESLHTRVLETARDSQQSTGNDTNSVKAPPLYDVEVATSVPHGDTHRIDDYCDSTTEH